MRPRHLRALEDLARHLSPVCSFWNVRIESLLDDWYGVVITYLPFMLQAVTILKRRWVVLDLVYVDGRLQPVEEVSKTPFRVGQEEELARFLIVLLRDGYYRVLATDENDDIYEDVQPYLDQVHEVLRMLSAY